MAHSDQPGCRLPPYGFYFALHSIITVLFAWNRYNGLARALVRLFELAHRPEERFDDDGCEKIVYHKRAL